jgi:NAD+--asparagine ADP-ribosyltransferase
VQERIDEVTKQIEGSRKAVKKLQLDFLKVVETANNQTELLKLKVDVEEGQRLWNNFERYAMYDDLKELYMKTVPEIFKFEQKIEEHRTDLVKQNEILRRFDEVIADKASKENVHELALLG